MKRSKVIRKNSYTPPSSPLRTGTRRKVIALVIIGIIALLSAYGAIELERFFVNQNNTQSVPPPTLTIFSGSELLPPSQWLAKNFSYTASNTPVIVGSFSSIGSGTDNSVRVLVMTIANFSIFEKSGAVLAFYNSGETNSGSLNVKLPSGNAEYTFVLDNTFDSSQAKTVTINATLIV